MKDVLTTLVEAEWGMAPTLQPRHASRYEVAQASWEGEVSQEWERSPAQVTRSVVQTPEQLLARAGASVGPQTTVPRSGLPVNPEAQSTPAPPGAKRPVPKGSQPEPAIAESHSLEQPSPVLGHLAGVSRSSQQSVEALSLLEHPAVKSQISEQGATIPQPPALASPPVESPQLQVEHPIFAPLNSISYPESSSEATSHDPTSVFTGAPEQMANSWLSPSKPAEHTTPWTLRQVYPEPFDVAQGPLLAQIGNPPILSDIEAAPGGLAPQPQTRVHLPKQPSLTENPIAAPSPLDRGHPPEIPEVRENRRDVLSPLVPTSSLTGLGAAPEAREATTNELKRKGWEVRASQRSGSENLHPPVHLPGSAQRIGEPFAGQPSAREGRLETPQLKAQPNQQNQSKSTPKASPSQEETAATLEVPQATPLPLGPQLLQTHGAMSAQPEQLVEGRPSPAASVSMADGVEVSRRSAAHQAKVKAPELLSLTGKHDSALAQQPGLVQPVGELSGQPSAAEGAILKGIVRSKVEPGLEDRALQISRLLQGVAPTSKPLEAVAAMGALLSADPVASAQSSKVASTQPGKEPGKPPTSQSSKPDLPDSIQGSVSEVAARGPVLQRASVPAPDQMGSPDSALKHLSGLVQKIEGAVNIQSAPSSPQQLLEAKPAVASALRANQVVEIGQLREPGFQVREPGLLGQPSSLVPTPRGLLEQVRIPQLQTLASSLQPPRQPLSQAQQPPPAPTIQVSIGRIEVRTPPQTKATRSPKPTGVMSLEDYLKRRSGGEG